MFKKFALIVAILLLLPMPQFAKANADNDGWVRVLEDNVYIYADSDTTQQICLLIQSYYLQIVGQTDTAYQVAMMPQNNADFVQIIGWVATSDVSLCQAAPIEPLYPTEKLTVNSDAVELKRSPLPSSQTTCAILNLQQVCYYGSITNYGKIWYYVRYAGRFGYVESSGVSSPNIPLHPTPLPSKPTVTTPSNPTTPSDGTDDPPTTVNSPTSEILLIVFVVVLAVGLTLALFLPGNIKRKSNVFDQDI